MNGASLDDQLFQQAMVTYYSLHERLNHYEGMSPDETILRHLITRGVLDPDDQDRRWVTSIRSMRHSSAIGDRLLQMLLAERERVSISSSMLILGSESFCRAIGWKDTSTY